MSPKVDFRRKHGYRCVYGFARPTHEYLVFSSGLDFETKILVKHDAPELLRKELHARRWQPQPIAISGVTDPYERAERKLGITRQCLEVLAEFRNPVGIVTKNHLVTRDADLLAELASYAAAANISVTTLDEKLQRLMEPRASTPARRLEVVRVLSAAGLPVRVLIAPVVQGLTDHETSAIAAAAAGYIPLRLPFALKELFETGSLSIWLQACLALARADPVDEWLQVALALSMENFSRGRLPVARHAGGAPHSPDRRR